MTGELPPGWSRTSLARLGVWGSGGTPSRQDPEAFGEGIPWLKIGDLSDGPVRAFEESITAKGLANSSAKLLEPGTLLVAMYGSIGKLGITTFECATNQAIAFCKLHGGIDLRYVFYALLNERQRLLDLGQGGTQLNISQTLLRAHEVNLAPAREQQRIVSRIEELFCEIDEGERALERVGVLVERYRQSVLKAAVTGELTREWRARISTAGVAASDDLPAGWRRVAVEELCQVQTGATPKRGEARYFDNGTIPWVTSGAVNASRITEATELITQAAIDETNAKVFPAGTLIVAMYGEGKTRGKISELGIAAAANQACAALLCADLKPEVKGYLRLFFEQHYDDLRSQAAGGVQPNLNLSLIKQTVLPLPPQPEAREICNQVAVHLSQAEALGLELTRRRSAATALRQSILKAAFSGQLVPQDPRDEPASALLARLAAQPVPAALGRSVKPRRKLAPAGR